MDSGPKQPPSDAYIAVVDIDPIKAHIGTYEFTADLRLTADTQMTLRALLAALQKLALSDADKRRFAQRTERWAKITLARYQKDVAAAQAEAGRTPISPLWLSYQIGQAMVSNSIMLDETLMVAPPPPRDTALRRIHSYFRNPGALRLDFRCCARR